jgi:phosphoglycolate phosphatase
VPQLLVLWDVDYTLLNARGVGRELYQQVYTELYGGPLPAPGMMAGRTDRAIAMEVLALSGLPDPQDQLPVFEAALTARAPALADRARELVSVLPGAAEAVAALAGIRSDGTGPDGARAYRGSAVIQSLLTGNIRALAEVKLAAAGLTRHLDISIGSYGDFHEVRAELVEPARQLASAAYGGEFGGAATVLVGDTPLDVEAALVTGARAVGVATGHYTEDELTAAGAHVVLPDLADTGRVVAAILAVTG